MQMGCTTSGRQWWSCARPLGQSYLVDRADDAVDHLAAERPEHHAHVLHVERRAASTLAYRALPGVEDIRDSNDEAIAAAACALNLRTQRATVLGLALDQAPRR